MGSNSTREELVEGVKSFSDKFLEDLRNAAHMDRSNLVENVALQSEEKRAEGIAHVDTIISVVEEELSARDGLASSGEILAAFGAN
jgi:hypothetical protein